MNNLQIPKLTKNLDSNEYENSLEWFEKKKKFCDKFNSGLYNKEIDNLLLEVRKNIIKEESKLKRLENSMRTRGMKYKERKDNIKNIKNIIDNFKIKLNKKIRPVEQWVRPNDIYWIDKLGIESFIRNNKEVLSNK